MTVQCQSSTFPSSLLVVAFAAFAAGGTTRADAVVASAQVNAIAVRLVLVLGEAVNFMVSFRGVLGQRDGSRIVTLIKSFL